MATASDDFERADGDLGANWQTQLSVDGVSLEIVSTAVDVTEPPWWNEEASYWIGSPVISANHKSQVLIRENGGASYRTVGATARAAGTTSAARDFYVAKSSFDGALADLCIMVDGATTIIDEPNVAFVNGDVVGCGANGSEISMLKNNVEIGSVSNATLTTGAPGLYCYGDSGAKAESWTAEDAGPGPQVSAPIADVVSGLWTPSSGLNLYSMINETPFSDVTYIQSSQSPIDDTCMVLLSGLQDPFSSIEHVVSYRYSSDITTSGISFIIGLYQGVTLIAARAYSGINSSYLDGSFTLTSGEADSITNYSDLRIKMIADLI